jgi:hypothetical protein
MDEHDEERSSSVIAGMNVNLGFKSIHSDILEATTETDHQLKISEPRKIEAFLAPRKPSTPPPLPRTDLSTPRTVDRITSESADSNIKEITYNLYGLDNPEALDSVRSLSSLAGSDSESDGEGEVNTATKQESGIEFTFDSPFMPRFTSTQIQEQKMAIHSNTSDLPIRLEPLANPNMGTPRLDDLKGAADNPTSQLRAEVDSQVDEFDKFMEADLGYGYELEKDL